MPLTVSMNYINKKAPCAASQPVLGIRQFTGRASKSNLVVWRRAPVYGIKQVWLWISRQVAIYAKVPVGIFRLEMSKKELVDR